MTAQELKNSILQLAIQGKLVEQRPDEGTAEELYRRIQSEKAKLLKAGKIKKEKPLPEITEDEIPFEIPETWKWVRLPDIIYMVGNKTNQILAKDVKTSGKYPAVSQGASLIDGYCDDIEKVITNLPLVMFGDHTKNVKYIDFQFVISADGTKFIKPIYFNAKYLFYWTTLISRSLRNRGYARHFTLLVKELFPLPPLEEQKRIVAKIEEIFPYIERFGVLRSQLRSISEDLRKSILQQAIQGKLVEQRPEEGTAEELYRQIQSEKAKLLKAGKIKKEKPLPEITEDEIPFEIPETWKWVRLQEIGELNRGRSQKRPRNDPSLFVNGTFPMIQTGDVARANGHITHWETEYNEEGVAQSRIWPKGTVCLTIAANIGDVAILDFDACFPDSVVGFNAYKPVDSNEFFMYGMMCYKNILDALSRSTAQKNINIDILSKIYFPLPPLAEQKRIVVKIEELLKLCNKLK